MSRPMNHYHHGFLFAQSPGEAMTVGTKIVTLHVRNHPHTLRENGFEPTVPCGGLTAETFAQDAK
jgi:hypothetical protein